MFETKTRAELRDLILDSLSTRYAARGKTLYTGKGGDAWMLAEALALVGEGVYLRALQLTRQILPDQAETVYLERHGTVENMSREAATPATLTIRVTGSPSTAYTCTGKTLNSTSGIKFTPVSSGGTALTSITTNGSGYADVLAKADRDGTEGNLDAGTSLTWSSAPSGMGSTGIVQGDPATFGADEESDASFANRVLLRRQERPGSANRADWKEWCETVDGIQEAYVYPCYDLAAGEGQRPGNVTVIVLGPPPEDPTSVATPRVLGYVVTDRAVDYVEGRTTASGSAVTEAKQKQLRPAGLTEGSYWIQTPGTETVNVTLEIENTPAKAFPWTGTFTVSGGTASAPQLSGDATALIGLEALFFVGTSVSRGGYQKRTVTAVSFSGNSILTLDSALGAAPSGTVYPAPPNWAEICLEVFKHFDSLGPGDVDIDLYPDSARWPSEEIRGRAKLYRTALAASVVQDRDTTGALTRGVAGVLSAEVTSPATDTTPTPLRLLVLGTLTIVKA